MARREELRSALSAAAITLVVALWGGVSSAKAEEAAEADAHVKVEGEVSAQSPDDDDEVPAETSRAAPVVAGDSKFQIHGFLTQAYATADFTEGGPDSDEIVLGIPEGGTTDYRFLALQIRYQISPKDVMLVQLSSRSLGDSPIGLVEDEIELDWAFYERRIGDYTSIKVGRIQIPLGIFNEVRDVGTLLPFYRPAFTWYREGSFTSETVDGVMLSHVFWPQSDWSLETDFYFGEWDLIELSVFDPREEPKIAHTEDSYGLQLWLNTPVTGLRLGGGLQKRKIGGGQEGVFRPVGETSPLIDYFLSVDAVFDRFAARAEWRKAAGPFSNVAFGFTGRGSNEIAYIQLGYHITNEFRIYVQSELAQVETTSDIFTEDAKSDFRKDNGIALNYAFSPNVVLKLEHHWVDDELGVFAPVFTPEGLRLQPFNLEFNNGNYSILSLAVSF